MRAHTEASAARRLCCTVVLVASAPFGECAKDSTTEWTSDAPVTLHGCQFFD